MELGGWSSFEMVRHYAHLHSEHLLAAANRLGNTKLSHHDNVSGLRLVVSD